MEQWREIVFFTLLSLIALSCHVESKSLGSNCNGTISNSDNSSVEVAPAGSGSVKQDPFEIIVNATDLLFKETLICPEGTSEDVQKCIRDITAPVFDTCAGFKPTYDCTYYRGFLKCEGVGRRVVQEFAGGFNEGIRASGCPEITDIFPVTTSASTTSTTTTTTTTTTTPIPLANLNRKFEIIEDFDFNAYP